MLLKFSVLASQFLDDPQAVRRVVCWPVLVWEEPPIVPGAVFTRRTEPGGAPRRPSAAEPLVLEVGRRMLPFEPERRITLGRTPDNDILVEDSTVSRTHAVFHREPLTGVWYVADEGSHNGTWRDGTLLIPGHAVPLFSRASLRFGDVLATFLQPTAFNQFILDWLARSAGNRAPRVTAGGLTGGR
ncbi:MAG TPA: FHA domain-containing protein [Myxococcaceae bacterium]|nr:FHA domain-containing protein [Myxococcaceae bacterium]